MLAPVGRMQYASAMLRKAPFKILLPKVLTPENVAWKNMITRTTNPKHNRFQYYAGRGIRVCDRWLYSLENFLADMGPRPSPKHSLERINNDGDYEPGNCRWATAVEQASNRRSNVLVTHNGVTKTVTEWADQLGIQRATLNARARHGWSHDDIVTTPLKPLKPRKTNCLN